MGRAIRLWLGPAVAVVVLAGLVLALRATGGKKAAGGPGSKAPSPTVVNLHPADVVRMKLSAGGKTLTLVRVTPKGKGSSFTPDFHVGTAAGPKAVGTAVQNLLFAVNPLTATRTVPIAPAKAGLQPPAKVLALDLKDGSTTVLEIGASAPVGGYYARVGRGGKVYLIPNSLPNQINATESAWLPKKAAPPPKP